MSTEKIVLVIIMSIIAIVWLLINVFRGMIKGRKVASDIADREGFYYDIKCEKCGTERQALYSEVTKNWMSKSTSVSRSLSVGGIGGKVTHYNSFSKKIFCPSCQKKIWHQILNYNGHDRQAFKVTKIVIVPILKGLIIGLLGMLTVGMCILKIVL